MAQDWTAKLELDAKNYDNALKSVERRSGEASKASSSGWQQSADAFERSASKMDGIAGRISRSISERFQKVALALSGPQGAIMVAVDEATRKLNRNIRIVTGAANLAWRAMTFGPRMAIRAVEALVGAVAKLPRLLISIPGLLAGGLIAYTIQRNIKLAAEQEAAVADLNAALRTHGNYSEAASESLQKYAAAMQRATTYGDQAILQMQAMLATFGMEERQIKAVTGAVLDLAEGRKIGLAQAATLVGKASIGLTSELKEQGIEIDLTKSKSEQFLQVLDRISEMYGGRAAAAADTLTGHWQQMTNALGDWREKMGAAIGLAPQLQGALQGLTDVFARAADAAGIGAERTEEWQRKVDKWRGYMARAGILAWAVWDLAKAGAETFFGYAEQGFGVIQELWADIGLAGELAWATIKFAALKALAAITGGMAQAKTGMQTWALNKALGMTPLRFLPNQRAALAQAIGGRSVLFGGAASMFDAQAAAAKGEMDVLSMQLKGRLGKNEYFQAGAKNAAAGADAWIKAMDDFRTRWAQADDLFRQDQEEALVEEADWTQAQVEQYEKLTKALQREYDARERLAEEHYTKIADLRQEQARQAEGFEERIYGIITRDLSEQGKQIQARGMAQTFYNRAGRARRRGDFGEERRLLEKVSQYAEEAGDPIAVLERLQRITQESFRLQQRAEQQAAQANVDRMRQLQERIAQLQKAAEIKIKLDTTEARQQLDDLAARMESLRQPIPGLAGAGGGVAVGQINVNVSEKLNRGDIRKLIVDELKRLSNRGRL